MSTDVSSLTPLHLAAERGHLEIVDTLVNHGADIDARDSRDQQ